ncbi:probable phosphoglycerate mutase [Paenibacillus sp. UNCCL117]|uniref:histidine phosphatase family protein n=1 Tax=unclassified Paenibacillus TaxID=185978 RepID=UPI00087F1545|nr:MULTISPECIES: histidine phosphatase family protein [unclassified Paenibacillus]SDE55847.1 probable phosphoglycerate mutase [Paenibacillus sp. cl123]SFW66334.1 probable phosphoglycerate mutase [Paenibacillus sp. UNCCL117]
MRLYIIRHGDPDYTNDTLTADGLLEAGALAERLAPLGLDYIYSSPLGRALATMKATADRLGAEHRVLDWASEITGMYMTLDGYGTFAPFNTPGELILEQDPPPGAEGWLAPPYFADERLADKIAEIGRGSDELLREHGYERVGGRYRCVRPNGDKVAVFCHGGLGLTWLAHLLRLPVPLVWSSFWLAPTSVTTIFMDQRSEQWAVPRCIELGDTSHLHAAGMPVKLRGIWKERLDNQLAAEE